MDSAIFLSEPVQKIRTFKLDTYVHLFIYKTDTFDPEKFAGLYLSFFVTFVTNFFNFRMMHTKEFQFLASGLSNLLFDLEVIESVKKS